MWRKIRILILLLILAAVAWDHWYDRLSTTDWDETLTVGVFPVDDAGDPATRDYIASLGDADVASVEAFLNEEAARYGIGIARPVAVKLYPPVKRKPPERDADDGVLGNMWWSLKMRWYARGASRESGQPLPQIRIFVRFHNPQFTRSVPHSVGMQKGLVGMVHAFATPGQREKNNVVIAHEILHTLGASDKYDPETLAPWFPLGFAEPTRVPRYPQEFTEVMGGRLPVSPTVSKMPDSLSDVLVGEATALEIGWIDP
jgi:hypothetical protein